MKCRAAFLSLILLVLWVPTICSAEWKQLEGKFYENTHGTKYYYETKMSYADVSSTKNPIVVFWGKTVFGGKSDPDYAKLLSIGCPPETAAVELKYRVDINKKKAALVYGILYDSQGRILNTEETQNAPYLPILPDTGAEYVWLMIGNLHDKSSIGR